MIHTPEKSGLPSCGAGRGSRQVRLAIGGPRNAGAARGEYTTRQIAKPTGNRVIAAKAQDLSTGYFTLATVSVSPFSFAFKVTVCPTLSMTLA